MSGATTKEGATVLVTDEQLGEARLMREAWATLTGQATLARRRTEVELADTLRQWRGAGLWQS